MKNFAVVDNSTGKIVNRIALADGAKWSPEDGHSIVEETAAQLDIGGTFIKSVYTPPRSPFPARTPPDPVDTWDVITLKIAFNHENRIRALEGKAAITAAQFKAAVKTLIA